MTTQIETEVTSMELAGENSMSPLTSATAEIMAIQEEGRYCTFLK